MGEIESTEACRNVRGKLEPSKFQNGHFVVGAWKMSENQANLTGTVGQMGTSIALRKETPPTKIRVSEVGFWNRNPGFGKNSREGGQIVKKDLVRILYELEKNDGERKVPGFQASFWMHF